MSGLTHFDQAGNAIMVDVTDKKVTFRTATAVGSITMGKEVFQVVKEGTSAKGDVLGVARVAGIMATKKTGDLIPMCHPLMLTKVAISFTMDEENSTIHVECMTKLEGKTGVEMEALTGTSIALLTIYDMCKAMDKGMVISGICLVEKTGGKSGHYIRSEN